MEPYEIDSQEKMMKILEELVVEVKKDKKIN